MLRCWLFGHVFRIEQIDTYILRWCRRCGKVHNLDMIRNSLNNHVVRLEWALINEAKDE